VVFTADAGGVTTKNSTYPRSELREMNGDEMASWSNRTGTHTLSVRQAVTELPKAKPELVTAQIHDAESDVMEVRLEAAPAGTSRPAATCSPTPRRATRRMPSVRSCSTRYA
jgi:hypothetical protein